MAIAVFLERAIVSGYGHSDFFVFYEAMRFYFSGQDIYSSYIINNGAGYIREAGNLNAPFLTLLLLPFNSFNYAQSFQVWSVILTGCLIGGGYLALRPFPQWHKNTVPILLLFLLFFPNIQTLVYGQISPVLFLFVTLAWLFCGLFLIYFLCLKRFRVVAVSCLTFLGTSLLAWFVFGTKAYISYYQSMKGIFWYAGTWNVSFHGFFMRLFSNEEHNVPFMVSPHLASIFTLGCSAILMAYLIRSWLKAGPQQFDRGFSLVIVSMLLLSPLSWIYYFPLLLIPYLVLVSEKNDWLHLIAFSLLFLSMKIPLLVLASGIKTASQIFWTGGVGFYVLLGLLILLAKPYSEYRQFAPRLWGVVYALIFLQPIMVLTIVFFSLTFGHRL
jgi:alpha-1,2-mannosyltransferase